MQAYRFFLEYRRNKKTLKDISIIQLLDKGIDDTKD